MDERCKENKLVSKKSKINPKRNILKGDNLMEFNSTKFKTIKPMRYFDCGGSYNSAKAQEMIFNHNNDFIATEKRDGEWCRAIIDEVGNVLLQSRTISKVTGEYGDKTLHVPHIVEDLRKLPHGTVLLGELCFRDVLTTSKDVGSILRCLPPKAIQRQTVGQKLEFHIFDCLAWDGVDLMDKPYETRFNTYMQGLEYFDSEYVTYTSYTFENFEDFLQTILAEGGEGMVIHRKNYLYSPGGRPSWSTLKVKKITEELELKVVDTLEPNHTYTGIELESWKYWIDDVPVTKPYYMGWKNGIVVDNNGTLVKVASGLTDADREWLATKEAATLIENGELYAVVSAMEVIADSGSLRHPRLIRLRSDI